MSRYLQILPPSPLNKHKPKTWPATTNDIVRDYLCHRRPKAYCTEVSEEMRLNRLIELFSEVLDKQGVDVLSLIDPALLKYSYVKKEE